MLVENGFLTGVKLTQYWLDHNKEIYDGLTEVRSKAISYLNRSNRSKEYIHIIKHIAGSETSVPLGYVTVKKDKSGKRHYLWVSGYYTEWRVLDRSGRVVRKPTKEDRKFWGI